MGPAAPVSTLSLEHSLYGGQVPSVTWLDSSSMLGEPVPLFWALSELLVWRSTWSYGAWQLPAPYSCPCRKETGSLPVSTREEPDVPCPTLATGRDPRQTLHTMYHFFL